ncbi:MAG TPA: hypothetical protein VG455_06425 [Acidimicrobiales bacterium]|nr:hypothetical protein [Acidimicrobiales bacterium]
MALLPRRLVATLVVALALVGAAAGCGDGQSAEDEVKDVVTGFFDDVADGDGAAGCAKLTAAAVEQISEAAFLLQAPGSCREAIESVSRQLSDDDKKALTSAEVNGAAVTGSRAVVADADIALRMSGQSTLFRNNDPAPLTLEKVGEDWKISSLG